MAGEDNGCEYGWSLFLHHIIVKLKIINTRNVVIYYNEAARLINMF